MKAVAAAALLAASLLVMVLPTPAEAATTRSLTIDSASAQPTVPFKTFDGNPPKVFDINRDGREEIIAQNDNQWVYIFDSGTGKLLAELKTDFPSGWGARSMNGPEAALFDSSGTVRVVLLNSASVLTMYRFTGGDRTHFNFVKEWSVRPSACFGSPGADSKPVLADLDRDGRFEILVSTEEVGVYAYRDTGALYWKNCIGGGNAEPTVGDLNQDGWPEVVFGSDGGVVTAMDGRTGATKWSYHTLHTFNLHSASMPVGVSLGQLDGLGGPDVVVGARDSHDATNWDNDHALLLALDSNGKFLWKFQDLVSGNPLTYTHAVIVDADRDGENEVYWADWNTIGHKPPYNEADSWKATGPANFYRLDNRGFMVWKQSLNTYWNNKDLALGDVDGDGVQEVLANGPGTGGDGMWYLDSRTGAKETFVSTAGWKVARGAILSDLAGDGRMHWIVSAGSADGTGKGGILVYNTNSAYSSVYPHLPYPVLTPGTTPPPPPPPTGSFASTFTIKAPNAWWQEVFVSPDDGRAIAKVELRVNGGAWMAMTKSSWGAWTRSVNTPAGTQVEFLATDPSGNRSQSLPFTWLNGELTKRSTDGGTPPPPGFSATFKVSPNINEWWVEVTVTGNEPISAVHARVNGGSWIALGKTSWGTWAKSFHVDHGAKVEFRATSSTGAQATSQAYTWP